MDNRRANNDILSKEDLQSKLLEMKKLIEEQQQLQKSLQSNIQATSNYQSTGQPHATHDASQHQRPYPSYEVLYNPATPQTYNRYDPNVSIPMPSNIHHQNEDQNLLQSSQFVRFNNEQQPFEDADAETSNQNYKTPPKNKFVQERPKSKTKENSNIHHSPYCANEENLKFRISEYQRREKDYEKTIQRLQAKLAIYEEENVGIKEMSVEKQKRQKFESQAFIQEIKELKQQVQFKQGELESKDREIQTCKKELLGFQSENQKLLQRNDQLNSILKNKQNDHINLQRQVEDLKHSMNSQKSQVVDLQQQIEHEKKLKQHEIAKIEEENKKKFQQLKFLVDQYREQMHEYQRITQMNQEMMSKIAGPQKVQQVNYNQIVQQQQPLQTNEKSQQKLPGRKHYQDNKNLRDSALNIFQEENTDDVNQSNDQPRNRRSMSEYRGTICLSAEKNKKQAQDYSEPSFDGPTTETAAVKNTNNLCLPSFQRYQDKKVDISDAENQLLKLQQQKTLLQSEFDRIPSARAKSIKQKMRKEELEKELSAIAQDIDRLKKKLRDLEVSIV